MTKKLSPEEAAAARERKLAYHRDYYQRNKARLNAQSREYRQSPKAKAWVREYWRRRKERDPAIREKARRRKRLRLHGMTEDAYEGIVAAQGGACLICDTVPDEKLVIDHCHKTGRFRGLLCRICNLLLGHAHDDSEVLLAAVAYLAQHRVDSETSSPLR